MVLIQKAEPMESCFKAALYGKAGSGKTFTSLLWAVGLASRRGKRVLVIDTEMGTKWYAREIRGRSVHPDAFDFDVAHTRSIGDVLEVVESVDADKYGVLIVDSMSHLWDAAQDAVKDRTSAGTIKLADWGKVKKPLKRLVDRLMAMSLDVMILGREKGVFEQDENGDLRKVGQTMRAEGETAYEPDICLHLEARQDSKDKTKTTYLAWVEKDRTGVLAGKTLVNANFETIGPVVQLLGSDQAHLNGNGLERDVQLIAEDDAVARANRDKKESKSVTLLADYTAKLSQAKTLKELAKHGNAIKKNLGKLEEAHIRSLRELHKVRAKQLTENEVGTL